MPDIFLPEQEELGKSGRFAEEFAGTDEQG
jgi:hypothetical protein